MASWKINDRESGRVKKVLVLNCYSRNSLAVINGLDSNVRLIGGSAKRKNFLWLDPSRLFKSRRLEKVVRYADPAVDEQGFVHDLCEICREESVQGIIPTGTTATNILSKLKGQIEEGANVKCAVEDYEKLSQATDKWATYLVCLEFGIPVPKSVQFGYSIENLTFLKELRFPIVIKPRISYASIGVRFFDTLNEVRAAIADEKAGELAETEPLAYIAQEKIEGDLHDVTACGYQGSPISALSQRRMVSLYDFGGGGIVNKTTNETEAIDLGIRFMRSLSWSGVLVLDLIRNRQGNFFVLECNPKIWGTTALTIEAGQNVAQMVYEIFIDGKGPLAQLDYERDLVYKWWFPEILFHWIQKPRNVSRIYSRLRNTFSKHGARRSISNLKIADALHHLGIVFDRTKL